MGKKDLSGKAFFADRERFAELMNAVLYQGKRVIRAQGLMQVHRSYPSPFGRGEMNRDILMEDIRGNIYYGLELETEPDYSMPERVMGYDICEFEHQIREITKRHEEKQEKRTYQEIKSRMKEGDFLQPVITVVLYLGDGHWQGGRRLSELFSILPRMQEEIGKNIPDYRFTLVEADYADPNVFCTDLKEFFQAMQCRRDKKKLDELCRTESFLHLRSDAAWAIAIHLDRKRFAAKAGKEELVLCQALDELMEDKRIEGKREGRIEGEKKGKKKERISIIRKMLDEGMDNELIIRVTGCSPKELAIAAK